MRTADIKIEIRLALLDLGRDPEIKLPAKKVALQAMLRLLRIEQARSAKSSLRADVKAAILARVA